MRALLFLAAISAHASSIPCFTVGPVVFTNCATTNTATAGLPTMGFHFVPDEYPAEFFTANDVVLHIPGSYILEPAALERSVSETLTADFSVTGYTVSRV